MKSKLLEFIDKDVWVVNSTGNYGGILKYIRDDGFGVLLMNDMERKNGQILHQEVQDWDDVEVVTDTNLNYFLCEDVIVSVHDKDY